MDEEPRMIAGRAERRQNFTYIGMVCSDVGVQPLLPQVVYVNEHMLPNYRARALSERLPPNFYVVRKSSGWNSVEDQVHIIRLLGNILRDAEINRQVLLFLDCASCHLAPEVFAACSDWNIWVHVLPGQCTWLLQPLDVYVFGPFKLELRKAYNNGLNRLFQGHRPSMMIEILFHVVNEWMVPRDWAHAFDRLGLNGNVPPSSTQLCKALQWAHFPVVARDRPTEAMIEDIWPRRKRVPWPSFRAVLPPVEAPALPLPAPAAALPDAGPPGPPPPVRRRLVIV